MSAIHTQTNSSNPRTGEFTQQFFIMDCNPEGPAYGRSHTYQPEHSHHYNNRDPRGGHPNGGRRRRPKKDRSLGNGYPKNASNRYIDQKQYNNMDNDTLSTEGSDGSAYDHQFPFGRNKNFRILIEGEVLMDEIKTKKRKTNKFAEAKKKSAPEPSKLTAPSLD